MGSESADHCLTYGAEGTSAMGNIQCCSADSCAAKAKTATQCCFSENIDTEVKADDQTVVDQVTLLKEEEKPPALWPEAEAVQGLVIEFDTGSGGSGVEKVTITKKPLGMTFDRRVPIKITKLSCKVLLGRYLDENMHVRVQRIEVYTMSPLLRNSLARSYRAFAILI